MRRMDTFSYPSRTNSSLAASRISCRKYLFCRALRSFTPTLRAIPLTYLTSLIISHPLLLSSPSFGGCRRVCRGGDCPGLQRFPGCCFTLSLHRNSHQFEVPSEQQRARSDEFPRRVVFACEVARVNGIELLKEGQVGTRNLHVHQVVHAHPRLRQHFLLSVQQRFNLIFYLLRHLAGLRINADAPCQIERVPGQDRVAKRRRNRPSGQFDYLPCWLRGHLRRHSAGGQNSSCEQRHRNKPHSTIHSFLLDTIVCDFLKSPTARRRECNTQSCLRQARPRSARSASGRSTTEIVLRLVVFPTRAEGLQDRGDVGVRGFSGFTGDEDPGAGCPEAGGGAARGTGFSGGGSAELCAGARRSSMILPVAALLTAQLRSQMRHCASVYWQPQAHDSALNL